MDPKDLPNGGPAFPCDDIVRRDERGHLYGNEISSTGISIRDYFAAKAMHQFLQGAVFPVGFEAAPTLRSIAELAYQAADAMLAARA